MIRVETIEQYRVLQHIKDNFDIKFVDLELINKFTIRVSDIYCDDIIFRFNVKSGVIEETTEEFIKF